MSSSRSRGNWCPVCGGPLTSVSPPQPTGLQVTYCSRDCASRRLFRVDYRLEEVILSLLNRRGAGVSICPSEVARRIDRLGWRSLLEAVRLAAGRLAASGWIEIVRNGRVVDPPAADNSFRLRLRPPEATGLAVLR